MAIKKVVSVTGIGRLVRLHAAGDVEFRRLTLIYGANGNGKTTLASILRSLQSGDPSHITERATLGSSTAPTAEVLHSGGMSRFAGQGWDQTLSTLEIFDSNFVNENVYTGDRIDPEHRKNLYQVIVGAKAVALAKEVDRLDSEGRAFARNISDLESQIRQHMQAPFELEAFLALQDEEGLEDRITKTTAALNAVRKEREILARAPLELLSAPPIPEIATKALGSRL
jgi:wobble nucleotide-excising tRNase